MNKDAGTASENDEVRIEITNKSHSGDRITAFELLFVVGVPVFLLWALFGDVFRFALEQPITHLLSYLSN